MSEDSPAVIGRRGGRDEDEQLVLLDVPPIADVVSCASPSYPKREKGSAYHPLVPVEYT